MKISARCLCLLLLVIMPVVAVGKVPVGKVTIIIDPVFNGEPLVLDSGTYVTPHGDTINISMFRMYISNFACRQLNGKLCLPFERNCHLFDAEDTATWHYNIDFPLGQYGGFASFNVGVDSVDNTSGAMGGDLDPAKGMYWAWNSGYIMAKLEGKSKVCKTLHHAFEFHIGGYNAPWDAVRHVNPIIPTMEVQAGKTTVIHLKADIAKWFSGNLDLSQTNSVVIPGKDACQVADRYAEMFTITVE